LKSTALPSRVTSLSETHLDQDIDLHIGRRLRARRRLLGLTQPQLADAVGVRFQQIQKYECGEDRISASRLWRLCRVLNASVDYFYDGLAARPGQAPHACAGMVRADDGAREEALDLVHFFRRLNGHSRQALLDLANSLGASSRSS
jgi:transcriptional regulator with XRE-family HTH domain